MTSPAKTPASARDAGPTSAVTHPEQQTLALSPAAAVSQAEPPQVRPVRLLWLCLYLPSLPLEALGHAEAAPLRVVFEEERGLRRILLASPGAHAAGVHPGLTVNAALALVPGLQLEARDPEREQRVLQRLAGWAERYTSSVVVEPPDLLLLELAGSQRLFKGLGALRRRILDDLDARGFSALAAIAPTPLAATWLAHAGKRRCIRRPGRLAGTLGPLPVRCLAWPASVTASLKGMGISSIGDCLRLPREDFARRFGVSRLAQLDKALGRLPDPRASHRTQERFCIDRDLDEEQSDSQCLLGICEQMLRQLEHFLLTRQLAVQRLQFVFYHLQLPASSMTLGSVRAERRTAEWLELLRIRLEQAVLPAPVIAIRLRAGRSESWTANTAALRFERTRAPATPIAHLVERLCARIGTGAVHGVDTVAEHRPDYAWRARRVLDDTPQCRRTGNPWYEQYAPQLLIDMRRTSSLLLQRPLWMLDSPERLVCREEQPCYDGPLTFKSGPERIETGWWDEAGIMRDYYVAGNPAGVHLWVFRHRGRSGDWYLHGIFG